MSTRNKEAGLSLLAAEGSHWFQQRDVITGFSHLKGYTSCRIEKGGRVQIKGDTGKRLLLGEDQRLDCAWWKS